MIDWTTIDWTTIISVLSSVSLIIIGYLFDRRRDSKNRKKEIRIKYLIETYKIIDDSVHRNLSYVEKRRLEAAISDIILFGKKDQVKLAYDIVTLLTEKQVTNFDSLLEDLRKELRKELGLKKDKSKYFSLRMSTYDGFIREKSVVNDGLAKLFPNIIFEESISELDHAGDIDYIAKIGNRAFGIQIKPITAKANFGNYSVTERMKVSFAAFEEEYGGKVFIVFSNDGEIQNKEVVEEIRKEIERLNKIM
ncbi:MAG: MjaI family restriction endonuclease [Bacteroidales bacterium]|jgi:hypothetical protein|nr:MjaI family restriction endonuclease [Bacteroidales bacterium]